jgi:hypothetical protein
MGDKYPLTFFYEQYKAGNLSVRNLEASLFKYILESFDDEYGLYFRTKGERIDFLCWFYPTMRRAIERYDEKTSSFDAYIATMLRYAYKSYRYRKKKYTASENNCWEAANTNSELTVYDPETAYEDNVVKLSTHYRIDEPKYVLLMLLKSYHYVSEELISKVASAIGMKSEILGAMIDALRCLQFKKIEKQQKLIHSVHCLYYRCLNYERQLSEKNEDWSLYGLISQRLKQSRKRLSNMRKRLRSTHIEATNHDLAKLLGVPKGTIDSRWALIKGKFAGNKLSLFQNP